MPMYGPRLLHIPSVHSAIAPIIERKIEQAELSADRVLEELRRVVFSDIGNYFDEQGGADSDGETHVEARSALASVETVFRNVSGGHVDCVHKIKLWDKMRGLEQALKYFGLLKDHVQHTYPRALLDPETVAKLSDEDLDVFWRASELAKKLNASA